MDTRAYLKGSRLSPQKAGLVANEIRGKSVQDAMDFLTFSKQKAASVIKKLLESAIANAENNNKLDIDTLEVKSIMAIMDLTSNVSISSLLLFSAFAIADSSNFLITDAAFCLLNVKKSIASWTDLPLISLATNPAF